MARYPIEAARLRQRSPYEVFEDHLRNRRAWRFEIDIERNYADEVVILCGEGVLHGQEGARQSALWLAEALPGARFEYKTVLADGEYAYLEWMGSSREREVLDGVDTFVIRDGGIVAQSIHYTVRRRLGS